MSLTPAQRTTADAYAHVFAPSRDTTLVLDDLKVAAAAMPDPLARAGATNLLLHILLKSSALRRAKAKEEK